MAMNRVVVQPPPCLYNNTCDTLPTWMVWAYVALGVFCLLVLVLAVFVLWLSRKR